MSGMSASVHFSIKYDGPALASHQMDVRDLTPALFALSNLLEDANRAAFPTAGEVRVNIQGTFKSGSFGVDLVAVQNIQEQLISLFSGPGASATANLLQILTAIGFVGSAGVVGLVKWLRGRKPTAINTVGESVIFEVRTEEEVETFEVDLITGRLYQSRVVRQALYKVLKPLEQEGIDLFACGRDGVAESVIIKDEVPFFETTSNDVDVVSDILNEGVLLQIESAVFKEGNKWRFSDGSTSFFAEITDTDFLARIESGDERFGKGDVLIVDLRRIQSITDNGLKLEYVLEKVREHKAPLQAGLLPK